ncbi:MAG: hypothetical protein JO076_14110 [Verrucomicrobia bacterium]|nr:hypothetical protein [Verrucomicrobiota bacterium]
MKHRFVSDSANDPVWDFLDQKHIWLSNPSHGKLNGKQMDDDQAYDYTILRGQHLRSLLSQQLGHLNAISDADQLDKAVKRLEEVASKQAKGDMLRGVTPVVK